MADIPTEIHWIDFGKFEHKTPDQLKIHPMGWVPAMVHKGHTVFESTAILRYLCRTFKVADHLYPADPIACSFVDMYLDWHALGLRINSKMWVMNGFVNKLFGLPNTPNWESYIEPTK